ncbi:MAG: hypothetical protein M3154_06780 [Candidatus Eremiobacteraeota bacterium]|nr:hypothetical protein [Candidatus Eremiobacteraeota bacterium]
MIALRILVALAGLLLVIASLRSAVRTFVLPRSARDPVTRVVFVVVRFVFDLRLHWTREFATRDRVMALYAPVATLSLVVLWGLLIGVGYAGIFWALGMRVDRAFVMSGSSLLTLGFERPTGWAAVLAAFTEAGIGLTLVALLVSYLPAMYAAFARRESAVTLLEIRAGSPPSASELLVRVHEIGGFDGLESYWAEWQQWFVELEESHTSLAALIFFRSPQPQRSWVTAAGAVLDSVALIGAVLRRGASAQERMTLRAGVFALRRIADFFEIPYDDHPDPGGPVSVRRPEFDAVYERLRDAGLEVSVAPEQAWADFVAARVQYDEVLLALAALTMAPEAPWSSDRALRPDQGDPLATSDKKRGARLGEWRNGVLGRSTRPRRAPRVADPTALDDGDAGEDAQGPVQRAGTPPNR